MPIVFRYDENRDFLVSIFFYGFVSLAELAKGDCHIIFYKIPKDLNLICIFD